MTLEDLRLQVYYRLGEAAQGVKDISERTRDNDILYSLNSTQREVQLLINFDVLRKSANITTAPSIQSYNLASDFNKMNTIWSSAAYDHELLRIYPEEYKMYLGDVDTTTGTPYYYDIYDNALSASTYLKKISIFPIPSSILSLPYHYYKRLDNLVNDTDENILTELYPDLYIEGAAFILYRDWIYRDSPDKIAFRQAQYNRQIEIVKVAQRQPDKIDKVSPKRIISGRTKTLYNTQTTGYSS